MRAVSKDPRTTAKTLNDLAKLGIVASKKTISRTLACKAADQEKRLQKKRL